MAAKEQLDQVRLDAMVEAAQKGPGSPYSVLEGKPFNLSASVARTIVVGSGLSKSRDEVRDREAARIKRWLETGAIGGSPKAGPKPKPEPDGDPEPEAAIEIPEVAAEAVTKHAEKAARKRAPRKTGEASDTAKAIAGNREPVASS